MQLKKKINDLLFDKFEDGNLVELRLSKQRWCLEQLLE